MTRHTTLLSALMLPAALLLTASAARSERPNFVLVMADDQGWGDVAYNGHPLAKTPVLDEMADQALRFDNFYAAAPVCSPTRGSVLTGRHPNRFGCFSWGYRIRPEETTLPELLSQAGYRTGHFGKWHLGSVQQGQPTSPGENGFDTWVSSPNFYENNPLFSNQGTAEFCRGESSMATVEQALKFIERACSDNAPFLAVIWLGSPHTPHLAGQRELEMKAYQDLPAKLLNYYGELSGIDASMGKLRSELKRLGVQKQTLLWYTSDNGARAPGSTGGLRGQKGSLWEGGLRVPAIIEWPSHIAPGRITRSCSTVDILPTVLELAETPLPSTPLDGESLTPLFAGDQPERKHGLGFWQYPAPGRPVRSVEILSALLKRQQGEDTPDLEPHDVPPPPIAEELPGHSAWLEGDFKLHRVPAENGSYSLELYNLRDDPREKRDLAQVDPARVKAMDGRLREWLASVRASSQGADYAAVPEEKD